MYYLLPRSLRNAVLLFFSIIFYAWGEPVCVIGIIASVIINFLFGKVLDKNKNKLILALNIILNLGSLAVFKYTGFIFGTIDKVFGADIVIPDIALPIGISFYTFQALSYTIDVYRGKVSASKNIIDFGAYITLFPQLIAGPIVRYQTVERELRTRRETIEDFRDGALRFATGLGKKVLVANTVAGLWDSVRLGTCGGMTTAAAWLGMVSFTLQIYFDFSGYSDMAIGLGRMFGFHFDENFDRPYISRSVTEFWRRWHISLSTWFKEYVYIPLGGNKKGLGIQLRNIIIVWLLTGLWHGAAWSFVVWGLYYAVILILEKVFLGKVLKSFSEVSLNLPSGSSVSSGRKLLNGLLTVFGHIYTVIVFVVGWGIFGLADVLPELKMSFVKSILFMDDHGLYDGNTLYLLSGYTVIIILAIVISTGVITKVVKKLAAKHEVIYSVGGMVYMIAVMIASTACIVADTYNPFLYFRF